MTRVLVLVLLVAACSGGQGGESQSQVDGRAWELLAYDSNEVEGFATLAEMSRMADIVAVAQAIGIEGVRKIAGGSSMEAVQLAQIRFQITRDLSSWDADSVLVEFYVPNPIALKALEDQLADLPPTVIALREKSGDDEAGLYRLVNSMSLWTEQSDGSVVAPLGEDSGRAFKPELTEIKGLEALAEYLEAARR